MCLLSWRCPPLMDITLHMLNGYLLASKAYLNAHLKETAEFERQAQTVSNLGLSGQPDTPEVTREELKNALLAAQVDTRTRMPNTVFWIISLCIWHICVVFGHLQDSAAVQILLEVCLPPPQEELQLGGGGGADSLLRSVQSAPGFPMRKQVGDVGAGRGAQGEREAEGGLLSDLREVQCLICCLLHQMFIADPNIAKLVHFQVFKFLCYSTVITLRYILYTCMHSDH